MKTIVVQGAVRGELSVLEQLLPGGEWRENSGYPFYETALGGSRVVLSRTRVGTIHAAVSTTLAALTYRPDCVINQGTAGGHTREMRVGDMVLGETAVYINNMRSPLRGRGEGSNALEWWPGERRSFSLPADPRLLAIAQSVAYDGRAVTYDGRAVTGRLGSGDLFSRETDRIDRLHAQLGELCEDMESAAVYKACADFSIPVLGVRVISNNELTGENDDAARYDGVQRKLQRYIFAVLCEMERRL